MMSAGWTLNIDDQWIAWVTFDRPGEKMNTLTAAAMAELEDLLDQLAENEAIKAVAIRSGKLDNFIVGADINELATIADTDDALLKARTGQEIFQKIADLPVPTVAVVHGTCLGGGMELALACDYRLVSDHPKTSLGQPEIQLGIIPGWGGTQRLPRLIGLPQALKMILTGKPVGGRKARKVGLADGIIAPEFLESQTREFVDKILMRDGRRHVAGRRRRAQPRLMRWMALTTPGRWLICRSARKDVLRKTHGNYPAPLKALEVIRKSYRRRPLHEGLIIEAEAFSDLACTPVCRNLLWLFNASRRVKKSDDGAGDADGEALNGSAAVIGGGIMGAGIAWAMAHAGMRVALHDINWNAVAAGTKSAAETCRALVKRRKMTAGEMTLLMHRIVPTTEYHGLSGASIVVEAVVEDLEIKKKVLREIESQVGPRTVICTNTSSLSLAELAGALERPKRFLGLHFFNPVSRMPLVEVVPGPKTSRRAIIAAADLVRRLGKTPIVVGDCAGFLVNRILLPYLMESAWMFEEGAAPQQIDAALERFGMPMGPLTLADEVGLDVGYKAAKVLEGAYGDRMRVAGALHRVVHDEHWMGRKSGQGFYVYNNGRKKLNQGVIDVAARSRSEDGVDERTLTSEQIVDRAVLIMINEAARCLEEGVARDAEELDLAMVLGTGFAPFRGGLLHYADERGLDRIRDRLEELAAQYGDRFRPSPLIERLARSSGRFYAAASRRN